MANGSNVMRKKSSTVGDTFAFEVSAGAINFGFHDETTGVGAENIGNNFQKIAYITNDGSYKDASGNPFSFLIGFNDSGSTDGDYDDYVVGVNAVPGIT